MWIYLPEIFGLLKFYLFLSSFLPMQLPVPGAKGVMLPGMPPEHFPMSLG
jgi:hypothetical protein